MANRFTHKATIDRGSVPYKTWIEQHLALCQFYGDEMIQVQNLINGPIHMVPAKDAVLILENPKSVRGSDDAVEWSCRPERVTIKHGFACRSGLVQDGRIRQVGGPSVVIPLGRLGHKLAADAPIVRFLQGVAREYMSHGDLKVNMSNEHVANMDMTILKTLCFELGQSTDLKNQLTIFQNLCLFALAVQSHQEELAGIKEIISALRLSPNTDDTLQKCCSYLFAPRPVIASASASTSVLASDPCIPSDDMWNILECILKRAHKYAPKGREYSLLTTSIHGFLACLLLVPLVNKVLTGRSTIDQVLKELNEALMEMAGLSAQMLLRLKSSNPGANSTTTNQRKPEQEHEYEQPGSISLSSSTSSTNDENKGQKVINTMDSKKNISTMEYLQRMAGQVKSYHEMDTILILFMLSSSGDGNFKQLKSDPQSCFNAVFQLIGFCRQAANIQISAPFEVFGLIPKRSLTFNLKTQGVNTTHGVNTSVSMKIIVVDANTKENQNKSSDEKKMIKTEESKSIRSNNSELETKCEYKYNSCEVIGTRPTDWCGLALKDSGTYTLSNFKAVGIATIAHTSVQGKDLQGVIRVTSGAENDLNVLPKNRMGQSSAGKLCRPSTIRGRKEEYVDCDPMNLEKPVTIEFNSRQSIELNFYTPWNSKVIQNRSFDPLSPIDEYLILAFKNLQFTITYSPPPPPITPVPSASVTSLSSSFQSLNVSGGSTTQNNNNNNNNNNNSISSMGVRASTGDGGDDGHKRNEIGSAPTASELLRRNGMTPNVLLNELAKLAKS